MAQPGRMALFPDDSLGSRRFRPPSRGGRARVPPGRLPRALAGTGDRFPGASSKVEGGIGDPTAVPRTGRLDLGDDRFFDGRAFDPDDLEGYIASVR